MFDYDVVIVGARIAGSAAALRLTEAGVRVLVIEKTKELNDVVSTHFMNPRGMTYLKALGVLDSVLEVTPDFEHFGVEVDGIPLGAGTTIEALNQRLDSVHPEVALSPHPRYACVRRTLLDNLLLKRAYASGIPFQMGTKLLSVNTSGEGVQIEVEADGKRKTLTAKSLIGADGKNSTVAKLLNFPIRDERFAGTFSCYTYFDGIKLPHAIMKKKNRISFAAAPTSYGKTMILVFGPGTFYSSFAQAKEENFFKAIREIDPIFYEQLQSHGTRTEVFRSVGPETAFLRTSTDPKVALLGDAASFKDQCTAAGMTHALRDAFLIGSELGNAFQGKQSIAEANRNYNERHYLDLYRFFDFTASQAEMNPLRPDENRLYRAISKSPEERRRFMSLYFDVGSVKDFFRSRRIEAVVASTEITPFLESELNAKYQNPFLAEKPSLPLEQTCLDYAPLQGPDMLRRTDPYYQFYERREKAGMFQYARTLHRFPGPTTKLSDDSGRIVEGINFASQDYLGLGQHAAIREAALKAIHDFGPHSAGSPMIIGNTLLTRELENELKILTGKKHVLLFPTGYAAGMGSLLGIVRPEDHIVMDRLSHACLQQGARAATRKIHRYAHLDVASARAQLMNIRKKDSTNAILLITEGLFSMDADSPDIRAFHNIAKEFNAFLFIDVAHDLGATGPGGKGQLGAQDIYGEVDFVMGSFSKTFACNGGFLATDSESLIHYLRMYSTPHLFSNALSPIQTAVALQSARIISSNEGLELRTKLLDVVHTLRSELAQRGMRCFGNPSPIVPVFIGTEREARLCHREIMARGIATMIIEYPVVPLGASRFRLQVMATHTKEEAKTAAFQMGEALVAAKRFLNPTTGRMPNRISAAPQL